MKIHAGSSFDLGYVRVERTIGGSIWNHWMSHCKWIWLEHFQYWWLVSVSNPHCLFLYWSRGSRKDHLSFEKSFNFDLAGGTPFRIDSPSLLLLTPRDFWCFTRKIAAPTTPNRYSKKRNGWFNRRKWWRYERFIRIFAWWVGWT